ncbi:MAG TPA: hypothetical protein VK448_07215 [Dissulfurispiraceae bacterium]|nr:hypothetical protein [Dissulfurispiraceae bacterium]
MPLTSPFMTDGFTAYIGDVMTSKLTFAVWLVDDFTQQKPEGSVQVNLKDGSIKASRNLSGYYLFNDLSAGTHVISVESDMYLPAEMTIDTTTLDLKKPAVQLLLKPAPQYPFPASATLLRGVVTNGSSVAGATVSVTAKPIMTFTDDRGGFVIYFKGIKTETVMVVIKKGADTKSIPATIEEGKTVSTGVIHFP